MAHAQKPELGFLRNGRVHLNRRGGQFSRLLAAELCASAVVMVVMLDTPCSEAECKTAGYPLHSPVSPSLPLPCVTVCHQIPHALYQVEGTQGLLLSPLDSLSAVSCSMWAWEVFCLWVIIFLLGLLFITRNYAKCNKRYSWHLRNWNPGIFLSYLGLRKTFLCSSNLLCNKMV